MNNCNKIEISNLTINCSCKILYFSALVQSLMMTCCKPKRVDVAECIYTEWPKKMYTLFTHQYLE